MFLRLLLLSDSYHEAYQQDVWQRECIRNAIVSPAYNSEDFRSKFLRRLTPYASDVCGYKGVKCYDNRIYAVALSPFIDQTTRHVEVTLAINLKWFPYTVQAMYFFSVGLEGGCQTRMLPRKLRFLHLNQCFPGGMDTLSLQTLPMKMEELHVKNNFCMGTIKLFGLPPALRIVQLAHGADTDKIYVDPSTVPESFAFLRVVPMMHSFIDRRAKIVNIGETAIKGVHIDPVGSWNMVESEFNILNDELVQQ